MFLNWSSSLWGCELKKFWWTRTKTGKRHPPCEDVSWKVLDSIDWDSPNMSSSLWGCELKNEAYGTLTDRDYVILLVRMWVEKVCYRKALPFLHRHPPCEDVSWKIHSIHFSFVVNTVILLVRMWVENLILSISSFGCNVILLVRMWVEKLNP